jgi:hypothetical protein
MEQNDRSGDVLCTNLRLHPKQSLRMLRQALESGNLDHAQCFAFDLLTANRPSWVWRELMLTVFHTGMPFFHRDLPEIIHSYWTIRAGHGHIGETRDEGQLIFAAVRFVALLPKTPLTAAIGIITALASTGVVPADVCTATVPEQLSGAFPEVQDDLIRMIATCFVQNVYLCCIEEYSDMRELLAAQCAMQLVMRGHGKLLWQNLILEVLASSVPGLRDHMTTFSSWMTIYLNLTGVPVKGKLDPSTWNRSRGIIITTVAIMVRRFGKAFQPAEHALSPPQDLTQDEISSLSTRTLHDMSLPVRYFLPHRKAAIISETIRSMRNVKMVPEIFSIRRTELELLFAANGTIDVALFLMNRFLPTPQTEVYDKSETHPTASGFHEIMTSLAQVCRAKMAIARYTLSVRAWTNNNIRLTTTSAIAAGHTYSMMLDMATSTLNHSLRNGSTSLTASAAAVEMPVDHLANAPFWCRAFPFVDWATREQIPEDARSLVPEGGSDAFLVNLHMDNFRSAIVRDEAVKNVFPTFFHTAQKFIVFHMNTPADAHAYVGGMTMRHPLIRMIDPDGQFLRCMVPIAVRSIVLISYDPAATRPEGLTAEILPMFSPIPFALLCILSRACNWPVPAADLRWTNDRDVCFIPPSPSDSRPEKPRAVWTTRDLSMIKDLIPEIENIVLGINQHGMSNEAAYLRDIHTFTSWAQQPDRTLAAIGEINKHIL